MRVSRISSRTSGSLWTFSMECVVSTRRTQRMLRTRQRRESESQYLYLLSHPAGHSCCCWHSSTNTRREQRSGSWRSSRRIKMSLIRWSPVTRHIVTLSCSGDLRSVQEVLAADTHNGPLYQEGGHLGLQGLPTSPVSGQRSRLGGRAWY